MKQASIGTLGEMSLHAQLKAWYARPGDRLEQEIEGFIVDVVRDGVLIEVQTGGFGAVRRKLMRLAANHRVRLAYPIAQEKYIVRLAADGRTVVGRRRSPRRGRLEDLFDELVYLPELIALPNASLEVLLTREEEARRPAKRSWRRQYVVCDRRLIEVVGRRLFTSPADFLAFLPDALPTPFTNNDLADALGRRYPEAQKITYCLLRMGAIRTAGKRGNARRYCLVAK